jgi:titin
VRLSGLGNSLNRVEGNFIGTNAAGDAAIPNDDGVTIEDHAIRAVIGGPTAAARNIISGNADDGIALSFTAENTIQGNFIGTNADGTGPLGNLGPGVSLSDSANGNLIGGSAASARNVISANDNGIVIDGSASNRVQGNRIGTDRTGTANLGNTQSGVVLEDAATRNVIGGAVAGARNIISGNNANGVLIQGIDAALNRVRGNFIGTDRTGTLDLGNALFGVALRGGAHDNAIGGSAVGTGNVISGNDSSGVLLEELGTEDNLVQGNWIGTDVTRTLDLGNALHGVFITDNASRNSVGGITPGAGNVIAFNGDDGVLVGSDPGRGFNNPAGGRNAINQNRIFDNIGQGIDLGPNDGVTPNDILDPDTGPNRLQNFPEVFSVELLPAGLNIEGFIRTEPNRTYRIEFFASPAADASGNGEGKRYLGFIMVITNPEGFADIRVTFPAAGVLPGHVVTATATFEFGDTSEFSPAQAVGPTP